MTPIDGKLRYRAVDIESQQDLEDLTELRRLCGWCAGLVPSWFDSIRKGDLLYYFFYAPEDTMLSRPLGSGGLDLNLGTDGTDCSDKATATSCMVGLFIRKEYAGRGWGKQMANFFIKLAFEDYAQQTLTCINDTDNEVTMRMFSQLGFVEFRREPKHHWESAPERKRVPIGSHRRLTAKEYFARKNR
ncbi:hypothetical protein BCR37DRAFT_80313 [Protomyces lactucae-debilis]|uniref:N-acetyltransferase domain-containing protein n=1 Tax=Protomyces lactucae-debilis TaxID=2754530 RepID=A0A1Y2F953_PROLT|nr:uncharacterized protein BCR37DRAFT_80313 [Protomyces lactucae-debilis]ORY79964.1 hypothetical protein BCR37DRAFT_80313 [Protomyces lactucae-debilis]